MVELSWKTPNFLPWNGKMVVSPKHPFKGFVGITVFGAGEVLKWEGKSSQQKRWWEQKTPIRIPNKIPNENSRMKWNHFQQKHFGGKHNHVFLGTHLRWDVPWIREIERRMRRHLRRGKFKAQQFIFAIKAATLGREGAAPQKRRSNWGNMVGREIVCWVWV